MAHLRSWDALLKRISDGFAKTQTIWGEAATAPVQLLSGDNDIAFWRLGWTQTLPSLPSGVSSFIPTTFLGYASTSSGFLLLAELIDLGNLNLATPTFTDGVAMPTRTEGGVSRVIPGSVFAEVTTVLNATPGSITVTYVDQDGNTAEATGSKALTASAPVRSSSVVYLNSIDWGVQDITTATRTGGTTPTGVIQFWGVIPLMAFSSPAPGAGGGIVSDDPITSGFMWAQLPAAAVLGVFQFRSALATGAMMGHLVTVGDSV